MATFGSIFFLYYDKVLQLRVRGDGWEFPGVLVDSLTKHPSYSPLSLIKAIADDCYDWIVYSCVLANKGGLRYDLEDEWFAIFDVDLEEIIGTIPPEKEVDRCPLPILYPSQHPKRKDMVYSSILSDPRATSVEFLGSIFSRFLGGQSQVLHESYEFNSDLLDQYLDSLNERSRIAVARESLGDRGSLRYLREQYLEWSSFRPKESDIQRIIDDFGNIPDEDLQKYLQLSLAGMGTHQSRKRLRFKRKREDSDWDLLFQVFNEIEKEDWKRAKESGEKLLNSDNTTIRDVCIPLLIKIVFQTNFDTQEVLDHYLRQIESTPQSSRAWEELSYAVKEYCGDDELEFRCKWFSYLLNPEGSSSTLITELAFYFYFRGEFNACLFWFIKALNLHPSNIMVLSQMVFTLAALGYREKAIELGMLLIDRLSSHPIVLFIVYQVFNYYGLSKEKDQILLKMRKSSYPLIVNFREKEEKRRSAKESAFGTQTIDFFRPISWHRFLSITEKDDFDPENLSNSELLEKIEATGSSNLLEPLVRRGYSSVPVLIELLVNEDPFLRSNVTKALRLVDAGIFDETISSLCILLEDEWSFVRGLAAYTLGEIGNPYAIPAIPYLIQLLAPITRKTALYVEHAALDTDRGIDSWIDFELLAAEALQKMGTSVLKPYLSDLVNYCNLQRNWIRRGIIKTLKIASKGDMLNVDVQPFYSALDYTTINDYGNSHISEIWGEDTDETWEGDDDGKNYLKLDAIHYDSEKQWFTNQVLEFQYQLPRSINFWMTGLKKERIEVPRVFGFYMSREFNEVIPVLVQAFKDSTKINFKRNIIFALGGCNFFKEKENFLPILEQGMEDDNNDIRIESTFAVKRLGLVHHISDQTISRLRKAIFSSTDPFKLWTSLIELNQLVISLTTDEINELEAYVVTDPLFLGNAVIPLLLRSGWKPNNVEQKFFSIISERRWDGFTSDLSVDECQFLQKRFSNFPRWVKRRILLALVNISDLELSELWINILKQEYHHGGIEEKNLLMNALSRTKNPQLFSLFLDFTESTNLAQISPIVVLNYLSRGINEFSELIFPKIIKLSSFSETFIGVDMTQALLRVFACFTGNLDPELVQLKNSLMKQISKPLGMGFISPGPTTYTRDTHLEEIKDFDKSVEELLSRGYPEDYDYIEPNFFQRLYLTSCENIQLGFSYLKKLLSHSSYLTDQEWVRLAEIVLLLGETGRSELLALFEVLPLDTRYKVLRIMINYPPNTYNPHEIEFLNRNLSHINLNIDRSFYSYPIRLDKVVGPWLLDELMDPNTNEVIRSNGEIIFGISKTDFDYDDPLTCGINVVMNEANLKVKSQGMELIKAFISNPDLFLSEFLRIYCEFRDSLKDIPFWALISDKIQKPNYSLLPWLIYDLSTDIESCFEILGVFSRINPQDFLEKMFEVIETDEEIYESLMNEFSSTKNIKLDFTCVKRRNRDLVFVKFLEANPFDYFVHFPSEEESESSLQFDKDSFIIIPFGVRPYLIRNDVSSLGTLSNLMKTNNTQLKEFLMVLNEFLSSEDYHESF